LEDWQKQKGTRIISNSKLRANHNQVEEALKQSEEKNRLLFENMAEGFAYCKMSFDDENKPKDFVYLEINDAFEKLTGLKRSNVLGKLVSQAIPGTKEAHPELFEIYGRVALSGKNQRFEMEFKPLGIWLSISVYSPQKGYFAAVFENITEQKELSKKIEEYSQGLEFTVQERTKELVEAQENLLKTERLAAIGEMAGMVGHDLRSPLTGINNAAYYLRKKQASALDDSGKEMLTVIEKSVEKANKIVKDLLDYSREMQLDLEEYSPKSLIVNLLYTIALPKNVKVSERVQAFPLISVDVNKIERVLINLVNNALEAMPNGGELKIASSQEEEYLEITLTDTGSGMTEELLSKIFTPLVTTKNNGTGLGLAICKRIIEAHGGTITAITALNKGTTFKIKLPIKLKMKA
jgi:PAS domain S-box-containing protein